jgi:hypothetical protein
MAADATDGDSLEVQRNTLSCVNKHSYRELLIAQTWQTSRSTVMMALTFALVRVVSFASSFLPLSAMMCCGAVSGQSAVSSVRSVNKDYLSFVAELLQQTSAARQQQVLQLLPLPARCIVFLMTRGGRPAISCTAAESKLSKFPRSRCSIS